MSKTSPFTETGFFLIKSRTPALFTFFCGLLRLFLLFLAAKRHRSRRSIHSVNDCQRLKLKTEVADDPSSRLKAFFNRDPDSFYCRACGLNDIRISLGKPGDAYMVEPEAARCILISTFSVRPE